MRILLIISLLLTGMLSYAQPANNLCAGASTTTPDGTCYNGTNTAAADNITGEAGCATQGGPNNHRDVWYSFTATTSTVEFNITSPSASTIELLLISGTCGALNLENSTCQTSPLSTTFAGLVIGQTYFYVISFPGGTQTTFTTCVTSLTAPPVAGQNCSTAQPICSNSSFAGNSDGFGDQELTNSNHGCLLSNERQSSWYYFQVQTSGSLDMTIDPTNNVDYDFALWGPMTSYSCPVTGSPIRCSYAGAFTTFFETGSYNTGFGPTGTETSDGTSGDLDGWASSVNALAGEFYILVIDNFASDNTPFTLSWGGSSVLSCAIIMPVELTEFNGKPGKEYNHISWTTASENSNDKFILQRSTDGLYYDNICEMDGSGTTNETHHYVFQDFKFKRSVINYYRLKQTDFNGDYEYSDMIAVDNNAQRTVVREYACDMTGRQFDIQSLQPGFYIVVTEYDDSTIETRKVKIL